jgi:hypothetical protein
MWHVGRYLGYTGRDADDGVKAARDPLQKSLGVALSTSEHVDRRETRLTR